MNKKATNPKDAVGVRKVPFSVIPWGVMSEVGLALLEGARKYGRHNYRDAGVRASVYFDASFRHLIAWWEGEDLDPDSQLSHVTKAIAGLVVLRDSMIAGNWVDDRPPRVYEPGWITACNELASALIDKYADPVPPFLHVNDWKSAMTGLGDSVAKLAAKHVTIPAKIREMSGVPDAIKVASKCAWCNRELDGTFYVEGDLKYCNSAHYTYKRVHLTPRQPRKG